NVTRHECRTQGQLGSRKAERLASQFLRHADNLEHHLAGLDFSNVILGVALAVAHTHFRRLGGNRLVRKYADPDPATTFDVPRDRTTRSFDLARSQATAIRALEAEI